MNDISIKHSVVIVSFNQEKYILNAIKSIYEQEIPPYELIILDDSSKDSTVKLAKDYITKNPPKFPYKIIVNEQNLGIPRNMQKAAEVSTGNVLSILAADDIWFSNGTRCVKTGIEKNQLNPDKDRFVCFSPTLTMKSDGSNRKIVKYKIYKKSSLKTMVRKCAPFGKIGFSRSVLIGVDYPDDIGLWADWVWDISICEKAEKYYEINENCFVHYENIGVSAITDSREIDRSYFMACKFLLENYKKNLNFFDRIYLIGEKSYLEWKILGGYFLYLKSIVLMIINLINSGGGASFNSLLSRYLPSNIINIMRILRNKNK